MTAPEMQAPQSVSLAERETLLRLRGQILSQLGIIEKRLGLPLTSQLAERRP